MASSWYCTGAIRPMINSNSSEIPRGGQCKWLGDGRRPPSAIIPGPILPEAARDYNAGIDASQHAADMINLTRILLGRMALNIDPVQVCVVGLSGGCPEFSPWLHGCRSATMASASSRVPRWEARSPGATGFVPDTNVDDAIKECNALAGDKRSSFATQVANTWHMATWIRTADAAFPYNGEDINHPGQYAVVSVNWSDDNIQSYVRFTGTVPLALQSTFRATWALSVTLPPTAELNWPSWFSSILDTRGLLAQANPIVRSRAAFGWLSQASTIRSTLPDGSSRNNLRAK